MAWTSYNDGTMLIMLYEKMRSNPLKAWVKPHALKDGKTN